MWGCGLYSKCCSWFLDLKWVKVVQKTRRDRHFYFTDVESCGSCKCNEFCYFDHFGDVISQCGKASPGLTQKTSQWGGYVHKIYLVVERVPTFPLAACYTTLFIHNHFEAAGGNSPTASLIFWVDFLFWSCLQPRSPRLWCRDPASNF